MSAGQASASEPVGESSPEPRSEETPEAQTTPPTQPTLREPADLEVRVLGDNDDALQKVPGSRSLLTGKEIDRMAARDTGEMLRRLPSVTTSNEDGHGLRLNVGLRGLDPTRSRSVLVLEDGVPIAINPYGEPDLYYATPVDRIRAIELLKGSGSVLFGPQTVGGVLNFVTIRPPNRLEATTQVEAGQFGFFHALARYGDSFEGARFVSQLSYRRADGPRDIGVEAIDWVGKVAFETSERGESTVKVALYKESSASTYVGLTRGLFENDPAQPSLAPHDRFEVQRADLSYNHVEQLSESVELSGTVYAHATDRAWRRQNYDRARSPGVAYERVVGDEALPNGAIFFRDESTIRDRSYQVIGIEPRLFARFDTGGVRHSLSAGIRGHFERGDREQRQTTDITRDAGSAEFHETQQVLAFAAYAQDRLAFRDWLLVTPGLRLETAFYERETLRAVVDDVPQDIGALGRSTNVGIIPGIAMLVGTELFSGYGGVHVGYAPPRVSAAIAPDGRDQELSAERSTNYEVGVRSRPVKGLDLEATGFFMVFQNQIVAASAASGLSSELQNGGSTLHRGVEASVDVRLGRLFDWEFELDVTPKYTFALATYRGGVFDDNRLPYAPMHHAQAGLEFEHPIGLGAGVSWALVGPHFTDELETVDADTSGRVGEIPEAHSLDASVRYAIPSTGLRLTLSVKNLTDEIRVGTRRPDGIQPAGFRQILAGLRWDFPVTQAPEPPR